MKNRRGNLLSCLKKQEREKTEMLPLHNISRIEVNKITNCEFQSLLFRKSKFFFCLPRIKVKLFMTQIDE